jgi:hypothetical protein
LCCTRSSRSEWTDWWGDQTHAAWSRFGLTNEVYRVLWVYGSQKSLEIRLIKPSILDDLEIIASIWGKNNHSKVFDLISPFEQPSHKSNKRIQWYPNTLTFSKMSNALLISKMKNIGPLVTSVMTPLRNPGMTLNRFGQNQKNTNFKDLFNFSSFKAKNL